MKIAIHFQVWETSVMVFIFRIITEPREHKVTLNVSLIRKTLQSSSAEKAMIAIC